MRYKTAQKKRAVCQTLKQKICESEGIQTEQIRLVVKGKQLKDQVTLKAAKLKNNSVVTMILSL